MGRIEWITEESKRHPHEVVIIMDTAKTCKTCKHLDSLNHYCNRLLTYHTNPVSGSRQHLGTQLNCDFEREQPMDIVLKCMYWIQSIWYSCERCGKDGKFWEKES